MMQKICFISIPKCGTHLIMRYLDLAGFRRIGPFDILAFDKGLGHHISELAAGDYTAWHYRWCQELRQQIVEAGAKVVFLYRDPRAYVCSLLPFILRTQSHPAHALFSEHLKTDGERFVRILHGFTEHDAQAFKPPGWPTPKPCSSDGLGPPSTKRGGVNDVYRRYARWLKEPFVFPVRFEDIIGPQGGGSREKQLNVLRELMAFTGVREDSPDAESLAGMLFSENAATFRKGQIDSWKEEFAPEINELFLKESRELLELWGYDPDEGLTNEVPR
jgi:hypothetical protein